MGKKESNAQTSTITWPQYVAGLAAAGGAFSFGAGIGWSAPAQIRLTVDQEYFPMTDNEFYWITSIFSLGSAVSCIPIGYLMNAFGRKSMMLYLVVPLTFGWVMVILAPEFYTMLTGRFLIGLAGGACYISIPQYTAEIAQKEIRGTLGSFVELSVVTGTLAVYLAGTYISVFWIGVLSSASALFFSSIFAFMPESPIYLQDKNKDAKVVKTLKWLRGKNYDPTEEVKELNGTLIEEKSNNASFMEIISKKNNLKSLYVGMGLIFFLEMSAINIVAFYATMIFDSAGSSFISPDLSTVVLGSFNVVGTAVSAIFVDKLGRKALLLTSMIFMIACLILLGGFFYLLDNHPDTVRDLGWLPLASLSIYMVAFSLGFGPIPWIMLGEIFSNELRPYGGPLCGFFNWFITFFLLYFFGSLSDAIGMGQSFWMFALINCSSIFFILISVPETKDKSLLEIQRILAGEKIISE